MIVPGFNLFRWGKIRIREGERGYIYIRHKSEPDSKPVQVIHLTSPWATNHFTHTLFNHLPVSSHFLKYPFITGWVLSQLYSTVASPLFYSSLLLTPTGMTCHSMNIPTHKTWNLLLSIWFWPIGDYSTLFYSMLFLQRFSFPEVHPLSSWKMNRHQEKLWLAERNKKPQSKGNIQR